MYSYASVRRPPVRRALPDGRLCEACDDTFTPLDTPATRPPRTQETRRQFAKGMLLVVIKG